MSATIIKSQDQFKSGYKALVTLIPVVLAKQGLDKNPIKLSVSGNKTLPGIAEGEEWAFNTDDEEQEIAETIVGKPGGISPLSFEVPYDPILLEKLVAHTSTNFTVEIIYDDTSKKFIYAISVFDCFLKTPGSTGGTANNAAPTMTVTLQPRGGGKLEDCIMVEKTARTLNP